MRVEMCWALYERGDGRLLTIIDAAEKRGIGGEERIYEQYPILTLDSEDPALDADIDRDNHATD